MSEINIDHASQIRQGEELNLNFLNDYLKSQLSDFEEITEITQFSGGYSNLTYLIKCGLKEYVLRRPPFGANIKSAHDMGDFFAVLQWYEGFRTAVMLHVDVSSAAVRYLLSLLIDIRSGSIGPMRFFT